MLVAVLPVLVRDLHMLLAVHAEEPHIVPVSQRGPVHCERRVVNVTSLELESVGNN